MANGLIFVNQHLFIVRTTLFSKVFKCTLDSFSIFSLCYLFCSFIGCSEIHYSIELTKDELRTTNSTATYDIEMNKYPTEKEKKKIDTKIMKRTWCQYDLLLTFTYGIRCPNFQTKYAIEVEGTQKNVNEIWSSSIWVRKERERESNQRFFVWPSKLCDSGCWEIKFQVKWRSIQ